MAEDEGWVEIDLNLAEGLGARDVAHQRFAIYIPNKDRDGNEIGTQRMWVLEALRLLSEINGGASAMPPVEGGWMNDEGIMVWENPVVVYSFIRPREFAASLPRVREFVHRLGKITNQGEVACEYDGRFFLIGDYD